MRVFVRPDLHAPFHHVKAVEWAQDVCRAYKPDVVVGLGDDVDLYSLSKYPRSHNIMTPAVEFEKASEGLYEWWEGTPKRAKKYELGSNHRARLQKRIFERFPEIEPLVDETRLQHTEVEYVDDLELDGVLYIHGHWSNSGKHATYYQQSTVHGHLHSAGLTVMKNRRGPYWALNCGWLGDETHKAFDYKTPRLTTWVLACATVTDGQPQLHFYPG